MRALVYEAPGTLALHEVDDPAPGLGEVLVEVEAAGICGTDHHLVAGELGVPKGTIPGHETAGRVAALGLGVEAVTVGQRVASYGQVVCGKCEGCVDGRFNRCRAPAGFGLARPGGFAEYLGAPATCLIPLPDEVPTDIAAIATDAIATPFHALAGVARLEPGETVVVVGCGGLGLHGVLIARMLGAGKIVAVDTSAEARELAGTAGADAVFDPAAHDEPGRALRALARGATAAFEFVGKAATVELALEALAPGGRVVVVGVGHERPRLPPIVRFIGTEQSVLGSFGSTPREMRTVLSLISAGRLDVSRSIGERVTLEAAPALLTQPARPARTVIVPARTDFQEVSDG